MSFHLIGEVDSTSYPNPNTLTQVDPFNGVPTPNGQVSQLWTDQGVKAFFPRGRRNSNYAQDRDKVEFTVECSDESATYSATFWVFNKDSGKWFKTKQNPTESYTGSIQSEFALKESIPSRWWIRS